MLHNATTEEVDAKAGAGNSDELLGVGTPFRL